MDMDLQDKLSILGGYIHATPEGVPINFLWAHHKLVFLKSAVQEGVLDDCPYSGEIYEPLMSAVLKDIENGISELTKGGE